ncbi:MULTISPECIES: IS3 family transposase [Empedobacter]|uniref:IS3 family transposase n=1 Tax=Empedobacter TaxID=59734 RepID=UPI0025B9E15C|nr:MULTISPECIES: IS3 family transposase [unclassified Empedobacter]
MKYQFIKNHEIIYPIEKMCKVLKISQSSYFRWKKCPFSVRFHKKEELKQRILTIYFDSKQRYGSPRITAELNNLGFKISRITVSKYMRELGIRSKLSKKFKITTDSKHNYLVVENILDRDFESTKPAQKWVSDITYIRTIEGFLYLTIVLDLYDRKVIGWSLYDEMSTEKTSLSAWKVALANRKIEKGLIFHSDQGVQYATKKFTNILASYGVIRSMSRKGNYWDNAVAESFFKSLKTELIYENKLIFRKQMESEIFQYIEIWYNRKRRNSSLHYKTIE